MTRTPVIDGQIVDNPVVNALAHIVVIGIDPSLTHTGICVRVNGHVTREYTLETAPEDGVRPLRLASQRDRLQQIIESAKLAAKNAVIAMETETFGMHGQSETAGIQAVYQVAIWELCNQTTHYLPVNVAHVKKFAGAQTKAQILQQVLKKWDREYKDDNLADAFVIATIGHAYYCREILTNEISKPQREVLQAIEKVGGYVWEAPLTPKEKKPKKVKK